MNCFKHFAFFYFFLAFSLSAEELPKINYIFYNEPIDVVIPSVEKDLETLDLCIEGIKKNCLNVRRVIVISAKELTKNAEWFDESNFPFDQSTISLYLLKGDLAASQDYQANPNNRLGWYYQQLLKLYASYIIPDLTSNVLILDSDTIFLNSVEFIDSQTFAGLYAPGNQYHLPYFAHMKSFLPVLNRVYPEYSGISHHMLFQKPVLDDLFNLVEKLHQKPFWQSFCACVEDLYFSGASEYEIYFNFAFMRTNQVHVRPLVWAELPTYKQNDYYKMQQYHYISSHAYLR